MVNLARAYNIQDLAALARRRLPPGLFDYIHRGAEDELTVRANEQSIKQIYFRQRVGVDVSTRDLTTTLFGVRHTMPVGIAVTGLAGLLAYEGEHALARAAVAAGVPFTLGTSNFAAVDEIQAICGDLLWRQIYPPKRRSLLDHHVAVAKAAKVRVLVLTLDSPVVGNREYLARSGFIPGAMTWSAWRQVLAAPSWLFGTIVKYLLRGGLPSMVNMPAGETRFVNGTWANTADDFTWDDVRRLRRDWQDVLVLKGISTPEDARLAADCGADGIIVSNHGGRSLDGCIPSIRALPAIVDAVAPKCSVLVDGGFQRGADILKALALGASGVMVGRATLYGLAAAGQPGVTRALAILRQEIDRALALVGCSNPAQLQRDHLDVSIGGSEPA